MIILFGPFSVQIIDFFVQKVFNDYLSKIFPNVCLFEAVVVYLKLVWCQLCAVTVLGERIISGLCGVL